MPITNIPYAYTLDTRHDNPPWHMDAIHIQQLYRLCERIRPQTRTAGNPFNSPSMAS